MKILNVQVLTFLVIAFLAFLVQKLYGPSFLFSLGLNNLIDFRNEIWFLPLSLAIIYVIQKYLFLSINKNLKQSILFLIYFFIISPNILNSLLIALALISLFYFEKLLRNKSSIYRNTFLISFFLIGFIPVAIYSLHVNLESKDIFFLILIKSCFFMRVLSWAITRLAIKNFEYDTLLEYIEFIFCPIFFIFPGQIQYFMYRTFHQSKMADLKENFKISHGLLLSLWGLFLMALYSYMTTLFWNNISLIPELNSLRSYFVHFLVGLYWLIVIYIQQTGGMAYQVILARNFGYNFKYDMHYPLFARTPLDYLRTHSSYVKDYIVEMGLKPLTLLTLRKNFSAHKTVPILAIICYFIFISYQTGHRPDFERPWSVTLVMTLFLVLFILLEPLMRKLISNKKQPSYLADSSHINRWFLKPTGTDIMLWILTLIILAIYKSCLGLVRYFGLH